MNEEPKVPDRRSSDLPHSPEYRRYIDENWGGGLGFTPPFEPGPEIFWAISDGRMERVKEILQAVPGQATVVSDLGDQPIHEAARHGRAKIAALLLDLGADVNARGESGDTPLHLAAKSESAKAARVLLERGAEIDAVDDFGYSVLRTALVHETDKSKVIAKMLLARGCHVDLESAVFLGDVAQVQALVDAAPDLVRRHPHRNDLLGDAIISAAMEEGPFSRPITIGEYPIDYLRLITILVDHGADPNAASCVGHLPLNTAIEHTNLSTDFVRLLIDKGARTDTEDFAGRSPREVALASQNESALAIIDVFRK